MSRSVSELRGTKKRSALQKIGSAAISLALALAVMLPAGMIGGVGTVYAESGYSKLADSYEGKTVILQTNDVHGAIAGYQYVAGLKKELEKRGADVILVDCGDYAQGTVYVGEYDGASAVEMMNACGYDYAALGNHEFDYGPDRMKANVADGDFKTLCADIIEDSTGELLYDAGELYEDNDSDLKIGFFGMSTPETQTKALPSYTEGLSFPASEDIYAVYAQNEIKELEEEGADLVICLSHLGVNDGSSPYRSYDLYEGTMDEEGNAAIDFILDGHSHTVMEEGSNGEPIMSTGTKLCNIGVLVIDEESEEIEDNFLYALRAKESDAFYDGLPADEEIAKKAQGYIDEVEEIYGEVIAESKVDLNGNKDTVDGVRGNRTGETNMGDLVTDAMLWYVNSKGAVSDVDGAHTLCIFNGGTIRAPISAGDVTKGDIKNVLPFDNTVYAVYLKGSELLEALEASTYCTPSVCGGFPQVSGIKFVIDETKEYDANEETYPGSTYYGPASINRVSITEINGEAFDEDATYAVITNNFCAEGGDTYYAFASASRQFNTGAAPFDVLSDYIEQELEGVIGEEYAEPAGRISYVTEQQPDAERKANTLSAKAKTVKVKKSTLRRKGKAVIKRSKAIRVTGAKGTVTYAKVAAGKSKATKKQNKKYGKYFKVNKKTGKITVKKGLKRGTYRLKIKVKAAGTSAYKPAAKTVTVKIRVK